MHPFTFEVSLRFFTKTHDPNEISGQLGLKPKWMHKIGEPRKSPKGKILEGIYDNNYCSFSILPIKGEQLHEVLNRCAEEFLRHKLLFHQIREAGGSIEFFIGWYSIGNTGNTFDNNLLKKLGNLQIDLALDIYIDKSDIS